MDRRPGRRRWRRRVGGAALLVALGAAACSGDDDGERGDSPDGQALAASFGAAAEAAYGEHGGNRDEDHTQGAVLDECFALDPSGVGAIAEALGLDAEEADIAMGPFINGQPGRSEVLTCVIRTGGDPPDVYLTAGTTTEDRDALLDRLRESADDEPVEEIEGDTAGLGEDQVLAVSRDGGESTTFAWVGDGFAVTVGFPSDTADHDRGFAALAAAVDAVDTSLAGA